MSLKLLCFHMGGLTKLSLRDSVCEKCLSGLAISEVAEACTISEDEVMNMLASKSALTVDEVRHVLGMRDKGKSLKQISEDCKVSAETLVEFLPSSYGAQEIEAGHEHIAARFHPSFYSYYSRTSELYKTTLSTGGSLCCRLPSYIFHQGCVWWEHLGCLYFTGGKNYNDFVSILTSREYAVLQLPEMNSARADHGLIYHRGCLYAIGGYYQRNLYECERFDFAANQWEAVSRLPKACHGLSLFVVEETNCLYAVGGFDSEAFFNCFQRLSLKCMAWDVMKLKLPFKEFRIANFKLEESQVYLVLKGTLWVFNPLSATISEVKTLDEHISSVFGPSYYYGGYLYCTNFLGPAIRKFVGSIKSRSDFPSLS